MQHSSQLVQGVLLRPAAACSSTVMDNLRSPWHPNRRHKAHQSHPCCSSLLSPAMRLFGLIFCIPFRDLQELQHHGVRPRTISSIWWLMKYYPQLGLQLCLHERPQLRPVLCVSDEASCAEEWDHEVEARQRVHEATPELVHQACGVQHHVLRLDKSSMCGGHQRAVCVGQRLPMEMNVFICSTQLCLCLF